MINKFRLLYLNLQIPEKNGKKIGLFRTICSIFGGLILAILAVTLLVYLIPGKIEDSILISIMFNTFTWAIFSLYISVAPTKLSALQRVVLPAISLLIILFIIYILR